MRRSPDGGPPPPPSQGPGRPASTPAFSPWLDQFFDSYYAHRPVNATFIGVHERDGNLPDFSEAGAGDTLADMRDLLDLADAFDGERLSPLQEMDRRLARGFLRTQIWEYESEHFHRGNPCVYTGEAVFGVMSLFLTEFAPLAERVESAIQRLGRLPTLLAQGRKNVGTAPRAWTERALRECDGALAFLTDGVALLVAQEGIADSRIVTAARTAANAFARHRVHLESDLLRSPSERHASGEEAFSRYLREGHFIEESADEIAAWAEEELAKASSDLRDGASDFGTTEPAEALAKLSNLHPTAERYYARYREVWEEIRQLAESRYLLTWPDFPIRFVARPTWARSAAPNLYFLFYRSPAAFERPAVHDYLVTPIEPSLPASERERLLRATNDSVIKLNHVIHHGGIGHHVQNWHAFRSASRIGRVAAVDCASRIAMFCGGTMAEGWACYATDLMSEAGALTPLEQYAERRSRTRMCARAVVDVNLHHGSFSLEQAARYYERNAGMGPDAARAEAVKNSMFPGAAVMYLLGSAAIHQLRRDLAASYGNRFTLRDFHDCFLSYGSVPVSLVAAHMRDRAEQGLTMESAIAASGAPGERGSHVD